MLEKLNETVAFLKDKGIVSPEVGIVLGTGLGQMAKEIKEKVAISYKEIPHFPVSTVESHSGRLIFGELSGKAVLAMQGRFHYYEGYSLKEITFPIRVMKLLGVKFLFLSNAAGGINLNFRKGDLVLIEDHINLLPDNPLTGKNLDSFGPRFPDMSQPYSAILNRLLINSGAKQGVELKKGIYVSVPGPNLETRAEYRYLKIIGADMVGMSTVPEVIVANHMGLPCAAISVITDECNPENLKPVDIKEIIKVAGEADVKLSAVFSSAIAHLAAGNDRI